MLRRLLSVDRVEDTVKIVLTLAVGAAALAASFTHVHDTTVNVLTAATGYTKAELDWFGWVVAMISEITPIVGLLSLRRRHAAGRGYMSWSLLAVVAGLLLSVGAQCAWVASEGRATAGAYLLATVPAIALALMSKVVMSDLDIAREISGIAAATAAAEAARLADLADREARAVAEIEAARAKARDAETEIEAARAAEISASRRAEAAEEQAAISGNEAARAREDFRIAQQEARRAQAEAAAASGKAEALGGQAGEAQEARRRADHLREQVEQLRQQLAHAAETAAKERARHARELAAAQDQAQAALAVWSAETPVSPAPAGAGGRGRKAPRIRVDRDAATPVVDQVLPATAHRIVEALKAFPESTAVEISEKTTISDRTIRKVINALLESGAASASYDFQK